MTALYMYDAAFAPNLAACKRRGAIVMSHYLTRSYAGTSAQPAATRNLGMGVLLNAEGYASELKGASRAAGRAFAAEALAAVEKGVPRNGTVKIFYSVDTDLTDLSVCDQAFRGINDAHRGTGLLVGLYGEGGLIERLHQLGLVQGGQWLSMSEGFGDFQHALRSGLVAVVQMHDAAGRWIGTDIPNTDRNTVLDPHALGAWWPDGSPYAQRPHPTPAPTIRKRPDMFVYRIDPDTVPAGATNPGWHLKESGHVSHLLGVEGKTNSGADVLAGLGQTAPVTVSYQQHVDWKAGK